MEYKKLYSYHFLTDYCKLVHDNRFGILKNKTHKLFFWNILW